MTAQDIFSIIFAVLTGVNVALLVYIRRRKAALDFRELFLSAREGVNSLEKQTLKSLEDGLNRREEALAEKEKLFSPDGAKRGPICVCTTKIDPGDGVLDGSIICFLNKENLESIPGFKGAARDPAGKMGIEFMSFITKLWENGNRIKEANLYVVFTESEQNGGGGDGVS